MLAAFAQRILAGERPVMVQPSLDRLEAEGETGLVSIDGGYSHAFGRTALLAADPLGPARSRSSSPSRA